MKSLLSFLAALAFPLFLYLEAAFCGGMLLWMLNQ
jgi:hypothetical protein